MRRREGYIRIDTKEKCVSARDWIDLTLNRDHWRLHVSITAMTDQAKYRSNKKNT